MEDRFDNIDQFFKGEFNNYSPELPEGMWESIQEKLAENRRRRILPLFLKWAAGIAILVSVGTTAGYLVWKGSESNKQNSLAETPANSITKPGKDITNHPELKSNKSSFVKTGNNSSAGKENADHKMGRLSQATEQTTKMTTASLNEDNKITSDKTESTSTQANNQNDTNIITEPGILVAEANSTQSENSAEETTPRQGVTEVGSSETATIQENDSDIQDNNGELNIPEKSVYASKWSIGGEAGPQYTYRNLASTLDAANVADINQSESGVIAYAGGVNVEYQPSRRFTVQSGIHYSKMGVGQQAQKFSDKGFDKNDGQVAGSVDGSDDENVIYSFPNNSANIEGENVVDPVTVGMKGWQRNIAENKQYYKITDDVSAEEIPSWRYYEYIEFPIIARYLIIDRKVGFHLLGGLSTNILMGNSVRVESSDNLASGVSETNFNRFNYSSTVGFGFGYKLSKQLKFTLEPQFKYYLNQQYRKSELIVHPYAFGVMTGVNFIF